MICEGVGDDNIFKLSRLWLLSCMELSYDERTIRDYGTARGGLGKEKTRLEGVFGDGIWLGSLPGWYCVN